MSGLHLNISLSGKKDCVFLQPSVLEQKLLGYEVDEPKKTIVKPKNALTKDQFEELKNEIIDCCLTHMRDSYRIHIKRLKGIQILEEIISRSNIEDVTPALAVHMIWACLSCNHHFMLRTKLSTRFSLWLRRRQAQRAYNTFDKLLDFIYPQHSNIILQAVISFYDEADLWEVDYYCSNLLKLVMLHAKDYTNGVAEMLALVETPSNIFTQSGRQILWVFYKIEEDLKWQLLDKDILKRIVNIYYLAITDNENEESVQDALEVIIRSIAIHCNYEMVQLLMKILLKKAVTENIPEENLLNFSNVLEHICSSMKPETLDIAMPHHIFKLILSLMASDNLLYSLLGNRVLQYLLDRKRNRTQFETPRIFFKDANYGIDRQVFNLQDKTFFQDYRTEIHQTIIGSISVHGIHKIFLDSVYITIALFIVEIPCAYTGAAIVCLTMAIQEATLKNTDLEVIRTHHLHAIVVSILSLTCYIHNAHVFYDYIGKVIDVRAVYGPQLNPPLRAQYKYAIHHYLWNKRELFFEDWEARYGLWNCFKGVKK